MQEQLTHVKEKIIARFNDQVGGVIKPEACDIKVVQPENGYLVSFLVTTKQEDDHVRLLAQVKDFGHVLKIGEFNLQLQKNTSSGDLSNEFFVSTVYLSTLEQAEIKNYLNSSDYKAFKDRERRLLTSNGNFIQLRSGFPLETSL